MQIRMTGPNEFVVVDWGGSGVDLVEEDQAVDPFERAPVQSFSNSAYTRPPVQSTTPQSETGLSSYRARQPAPRGADVMQQAQQTARGRRGYVPPQREQPVQPYPTPAAFAQPVPTRFPDDVGDPYAAPAHSDWRQYLQPWQRQFT